MSRNNNRYQRKSWIRLTSLWIAGSIAALCLGLSGCGQGAASHQSSQDIIEELLIDYGNYGEESSAQVDDLLTELESFDEDLGNRWRKIIDIWKSVEDEQELHYDVLPDGLPDTYELCIVALGFQLEKDGTMRKELIERLKVVLKSAKKYPNAYVLCTGGGTATKKNSTVTEAGEMAKWLIEKGVDQKRIIIEDNSITTSQNAIYSYDILEEKYPMVKKIAIVSSDYHIATGTLLFRAESILRADKDEDETFSIISNAAWKAPSGSLSSTFQAGALIELSGDVETAFEIYYDTYDIHELPTLK